MTFSGDSGNAVTVSVYRIADGAEVARMHLKTPQLVSAGIGRARWMPDGKRIVFIDAEADGVSSLYMQDFVPGQDTSSTRRLLLHDPDRPPETIGVSPDGNHIVYGVIDVQSNLLLLEGVKDVKR